MRVLGVDPGLNITGYAVIEFTGSQGRLLEAGAIKPGRSPELGARLRELYADLLGVINEFRPTLGAIESLYSEYRYPRTALQMAHARGVICLAMAQAGCTVLDLPPSVVKNSIVGAGRASKEQVQRTIQSYYRLDQPPHPPDVADALAVATAAAFRYVRSLEQAR